MEFAVFEPAGRCNDENKQKISCSNDNIPLDRPMSFIRLEGLQRLQFDETFRYRLGARVFLFCRIRSESVLSKRLV